MESLDTKTNIFGNFQIIILGVCIVLATVASTVILSQGLLNMKKFSSELISVTGSAEKKILSDFTVWRSNFSQRNIDMKMAFQDLKNDLATVKDYLASKGITENEIIVSQVDTQVLYKKDEKGYDTNLVEGYRLTQSIVVQSTDVAKVTEVSRQSTELIDKGIQFISDAPEYFYTKLAELKLDMLAEATRDAKKRAEQMAASSGGKIGTMRSAKMGVFQITPANSFEISDAGMNDTSSLEKRVTAVVRVDFAISQ